MLPRTCRGRGPCLLADQRLRGLLQGRTYVFGTGSDHVRSCLGPSLYVSSLASGDGKIHVEPCLRRGEIRRV